MHAGLEKYLDRRVPRYTSYPTAVHFASDVGAPTYLQWLTALRADIPVSFYIHIPFCAQMCLYCGCHTTVARRYTPIAAYVELLEHEFALVAGAAGRRTITQLHFGGGTPTILTPADFRRIGAALRTHFSISPQTEIAIEIDPRTLERSYAAVLAELGITRASLGVQDFDPRVQQAVRREQSFDQTARAVDWLRDAGIPNINLDLMYGLPYQTEVSVTASAARAVELAPDRIALFGYAHVPWMKRHQRLIPEAALPSNRARFEQSRAAADILRDAGYQAIGLDHFAKQDDPLACAQRQGLLHRNFQGYTVDDAPALLGFGASAIGRLAQGYVQNAPSLVAYREAIAGGSPATIRGHELSREDRLRADVIERLMCDFSVDLAEHATAHERKLDHFASELIALDALELEGLIERRGGVISIPQNKRPFVRIVCAVFDTYAPDETMRYSRAS